MFVRIIVIDIYFVALTHQILYVTIAMLVFASVVFAVADFAIIVDLYRYSGKCILTCLVLQKSCIIIFTGSVVMNRCRLFIFLLGIMISLILMAIGVIRGKLNVTDDACAISPH